MSRDDGGPAFPCLEVEHYPAGYGHGAPCSTRNMPGMTLRDYFAAHAPVEGHVMMSLLAVPSKVAEWAYAYADAMLAQREK